MSTDRAQQASEPTPQVDMDAPQPSSRPEGVDEDEAELVSRQLDIPDVAISYFRLFEFSTPRDLAIVLLSCFGAAASGAALPSMTIIFGRLSASFQQYTIHAISYDELISQLDSYTLDFVYIAIGQFVVAYLAVWGFICTGERLTQRIRAAYLASLLRQNIGLFDKLGAGEVTTRITADMQSIQEGLSEKVSQTISAVATFVAAFIIGFVNYWKLALILLSAPIAIVIFIFFGFSFAAKSAQANLKEVGTAGTMAHEVLDSIRTVAALGLEGSMARKFDDQILIAKKHGRRSRVAIDIIVGAMQGVNFAAFGLIFWLGSRFVVDGEEHFGSVVTMALALTMGATALGRVTPNIRAFSVCVNAASLAPTDMVGHVKLQGVTHLYPSRPGTIVMQDFSIDIPAGKTTALVGSSGSGKSTIIQLLQRFYLPIKGQITIDGNAIESLNVRWLRSKMSVVSQEPLIFKGTVLDNIAFGLTNTPLVGQDIATTRRLVIEAAKIANADEFIRDLEHGYDTEIGGMTLSGGQKQRLAIARAVIRQPAILLLDEATSALDTKSEKLVQKAIEDASRSRTTVIVAHRLSTIKHADNIVVMAHGKVVEQGTHADLTAQNGVYAALVNAQQLSQEESADSVNVAGSTESKTEQLATSEAVGKPESTRNTQSVQYMSSEGNENSKIVSETFDPIRKQEYGEKSLEPAAIEGGKSSGAESEPTLQNNKSTGKSTGLKRLLFWKGKGSRPQNAVAKVPEGPGTWTLVKFVASLNKGDTWIIILVLLSSTIIGAAFPTNSVFFAEAVVTIALAPTNPSYALSRASFWSLMYLMLAIVIALTLLVQGFAHATAAERLLYRARSLTYKAFLRQEIGWFDDPKHSTGALIDLLASQPNGLAGMSGITLGTVLSAVSTTLIALIVSISVGWQLGLVCASTVPVLLLCGYLRVRVINTIEATLKNAHDESARFASESISSIREVASLTLEQHVLERFRGTLSPELHSIVISSAKSSLFWALSQSLVFLCFALGFWYGGTQIAQGRYTLLQFFICYSTVIFGAQAAGQIFSYAPDMSKAAQAATILEALFKREPRQQVIGSPVHSMTGAISFRDVYFTYPTRPDHPALRGIDLTIKPGQSVALVGASGCGKSTIISLLERFYTPTSGTILVDNIDISTLDLSQFRSHISIVPQQPLLYQGTIRENILHGVPEGEHITDTHFERVCRDADVWDFVTSLPEGFDTVCGSRGGLLSGGQKQRVAIARALVRDPRVLLLDESTSALDSNSERVVQRALDRVSAGRTTISVSHRLSAIQGADVIFVVDAGRVVERGSHAELYKMGGRYAELVKAQSLAEGSG